MQPEALFGMAFSIIASISLQNCCLWLRNQVKGHLLQSYIFR